MTEGEYFPKPEGVEPEKEERQMPYEQVAGRFGLSADRLRRLLNTGRVQGEKLRKQGKGYPWRWVTSARAVGRYKTSVKTPREYGLLGGRPRKRVSAAA
jgi:hypothetical protein